jgi:hypothetical protein
MGGNLDEIAFADGLARERIAALLHEISLGSGRGELAQELIADGPVYQSDPAGSGAIEMIEPNGRRTLGRLENRRFVSIERP